MVKKFRVIISAIALLFSIQTQAQQTPPPPPPPETGSVCSPDTPTDVRTGTVTSGDTWFYWWCRNSTSIWLNYTIYSRAQLQEKIWYSANIYSYAPMKSYMSDNSWAKEVYTNGIPIGKETAYTGMQQVAAADTLRPVPGIPYNGKFLPEIWVVTPNGSNLYRKTSKVVNGVVQAYGTGTQLSRIGRICNKDGPSYPLGSVVKYLSLRDNEPITITDEVISCIRIQ